MNIIYEKDLKEIEANYKKKLIKDINEYHSVKAIGVRFLLSFLLATLMEFAIAILCLFIHQMLGEKIYILTLLLSFLVVLVIAMIYNFYVVIKSKKQFNALMKLNITDKEFIDKVENNIDILITRNILFSYEKYIQLLKIFEHEIVDVVHQNNDLTIKTLTSNGDITKNVIYNIQSVENTEIEDSALRIGEDFNIVFLKPYPTL